VYIHIFRLPVKGGIADVADAGRIQFSGKPPPSVSIYPLEPNARPQVSGVTDPASNALRTGGRTPPASEKGQSSVVQVPDVRPCVCSSSRSRSCSMMATSLRPVGVSR